MKFQFIHICNDLKVPNQTSKGGGESKKGYLLIKAGINRRAQKGMGMGIAKNGKGIYKGTNPTHMQYTEGNSHKWQS